MGLSLIRAGQVRAASTYFRLLADATGRRLGADHPDTLAARGYIAFSRGLAGDATGAAAAFAELLPDLLRVLGPDHPHTITTRYGDIILGEPDAEDASEDREVFVDLLPYHLLLEYRGPGATS